MNTYTYQSTGAAIDLDSTADHLRHLIEVCKDAAHGFKTAADETKDAGLKAFFLCYSKQRSTFVHELEVRLISLGCDTKESGSLSGSLHRGWLNLRAALSSNEPHAVLAECERGEDTAVNAYREALEKLEDTASRELVSRQFASVYAAHNEVRALRDSTPPSSKT
jgi:uncharacterized protein (TIGR02284 family)